MPPFDPISEAYRQWVTHDLGEPLAMAAATSIMRSQQLVSTAVDRALRPLDLTFARYEVLMLLNFTKLGALPMTKMGERLMIHPSGITKLIDKLQQQDLVRREANSDDRRVTLARITPRGRQLANLASDAVGAIRFGMNLNDDELTRIVEALMSFRRQVGDVSGSA